MDEEIFLQDRQHKQRFQNMIKLEITENECIQCEIYVNVCLRANIKLEDKPIIGNNCEQCSGCVHHCINNVIRTNIQKTDERFINSHITVSQIIEANNQH